MQENDLGQRVQAVETAQAVQAAVSAGTEATQAAVQAGVATTSAAVQAGTIAMIATGSLAFIVGLFRGLTIRSTR